MALVNAYSKVDDNDFEKIIPLGQTGASITPINLRVDDGDIASKLIALQVASGVPSPQQYIRLDRQDWERAALRIQQQLNQRTATISIASPAVVTLAAHGFTANQPIRFQSTGALPTGLAIGPTYYVVGGGTLLAGSFNVTNVPGGAAINTTGTQSGTHVVFAV